ncbi:hypothetical protein ACNO1E_005112 [Escherichia coli]|nr:hypothetical protein [Escherichia coli]HDQ6655697.1 hypothetical protein [Escherichia coli O22:H16]EEU1882970.1 hypothetical protein [Escherichia coli]EEV0613328.1 hypothetical protein [Escherichia coli]EEV2469161.1 hypothetical protein [Escherichia coli]
MTPKQQGYYGHAEFISTVVRSIWVEVEAENVDSEIEDKIKILTEQIIKSQQS